MTKKILAWLLVAASLAVLAGCSNPASGESDSDSETPTEPATVPTYTVTYFANGGSGDIPLDTAKYASGTEVTILPSTGISRSGYAFTAWNLKADGSGTSYEPGSKMTMGGENASLYAQWEPRASVTVTVPVSEDNAPVITGETTVAADGNVSLSVSGTWKTVTWYCNGREISTDAAVRFTGSDFDIGKTLITVVVTDDSGNSYSSSVVLTITQ